MLESQREILKKQNKDYLSIGITENGQPRRAIPVPWQYTSNAYNMCCPTVYLEPADLEDRELMAELERYHVRGMYIFTALEDYSFIARFPGLWDVYICRGGGWIDLDFMNRLPQWSMFHLRDAIVPDISPVFTDRREMLLKRRKVCLTNYRIDSPEEDSDPNVFITELLVE